VVQTARPVSPDQVTGGWYGQDDSQYQLFNHVNDASDATYIYYVAGSGQLCGFLLGSLTDPVSSTGHVVYIRGQLAYGNTATAYLYQGGTSIAVLGTVAADVAVTTRSYELSAAEANSITNYADLRVYIQAGAGQAGPNVHDIWMQVPDPAVNANVTAGNVAGATTVLVPAVAWTTGVYLYTPDVPVRAWVPISDPSVSVDVAFLDPPASLSATPIGDDRIDLSWSAVDGATVYDLERDGVTLYPPISGTFYSDTGLEAARTYTYRVRGRP